MLKYFQFVMLKYFQDRQLLSPAKEGESEPPAGEDEEQEQSGGAKPGLSVPHQHGVTQDLRHQSELPE